MADNQKRETAWAEAKQKCRLSAEEVRMAKELGLSPRSLIKNIPSPQQRWKAPVGVWVRELYENRGNKPEAKVAKEKRSGAAPARPVAAAPLAEPDPPPEPHYTGRFIDAADIDLDRLRAEARNKLADTVDSEAELDELVAGFDDNDLITFFGDHLPPTLDEAKKEDEGLLRRHRNFGQAARFVGKSLSRLPAVRKVALFGSVARELQREVPRFKKFRRAGVALWHECKDVDLAVWVDDLTDLRTLQRACREGLNRLRQELNITFATHQVDIFIMEPETDRYLGHLCIFNACPKGRKLECLVPGCGQPKFLQQHEDFEFHANALAPHKTVVLYEAQGRRKERPDNEPMPF